VPLTDPDDPVPYFMGYLDGQTLVRCFKFAVSQFQVHAAVFLERFFVQTVMRAIRVTVDFCHLVWLAPILCTRRCESRINRYRCVLGPA
jgi:hypothetical protein